MIVAHNLETYLCYNVCFSSTMEEVGEDDEEDSTGEIACNLRERDVDNLQMNATAQERQS